MPEREESERYGQGITKSVIKLDEESEERSIPYVSYPQLSQEKTD